MRVGKRATITSGGRMVPPLQMLAPLGAAAALSFPVAAIYFPIGVIVQSPGNAQMFGGPLGLWILASVIGMVSLFLVFAVARPWVPRNGNPGPLAVLAWYGVATIAQAVTFGFAAVLLGLDGSPELPFRLSGILFQVPLLAAVGYATVRYDAHHRIVASLERTRERLLVVGEGLEADLDRAETALATAVGEQLDPAVTVLETTLSDAEAGGDGVEVISALDSLVEERIRPLVSELASQEEGPAETVEEVTGARTRVPLPKRFLLGDAIKPLLLGIIVLLAAVPSAARVLQPGETVLYIAAFSASTFGLLWLARFAIGLARVQTIPGAVIVTCLYGAVGLVTYELIGVIGIARPTGLEATSPAFFGFLGLAITLELLVEGRRTRSEGELEAETIRLEHVLGLIRRRERLVKRRLAFVVHGALQGALSAAALRIAEAGEVTAQLGREIRQDIKTALSEVEVRRDSGVLPGSGGQLRTTTTITEISAVWSGRRRFEATVDPSVDDMLSGDADVDEAVAEVIREAVNNAFRHGAAVKVEVEVTMAAGDPPQSSDEIAITVRNDGDGPSGSSKPGFGSTLFDDLCHTWTLGTDGLWTVFKGRVTLDARHAPGGDRGTAGSSVEAFSGREASIPNQT